MSTAPDGTRVVLYGRSRCHLCDVARDVVAEVCEELGESFTEVDIESSAELVAQFGELVPVIVVDGAQVAHWRVDAEVVRRALTGG